MCHFRSARSQPKFGPKSAVMKPTLQSLVGRCALAVGDFWVVGLCFDWSLWYFPPGLGIGGIAKKRRWHLKGMMFSCRICLGAWPEYHKKKPWCVSWAISGLIGSWLSALKVRNAKPATSSATHTQQRS